MFSLNLDVRHLGVPAQPLSRRFLSCSWKASKFTIQLRRLIANLPLQAIDVVIVHRRLGHRHHLLFILLDFIGEMQTCLRHLLLLHVYEVLRLRIVGEGGVLLGDAQGAVSSSGYYQLRQRDLVVDAFLVMLMAVDA